MSLHPHINRRFNSVTFVMLDVVIALVPVIVAATLAHGRTVIQHLVVAVLSALVTEYISSAFLLKKRRARTDGSAIVTALLLVCTLAPLTSWYVVAFGSFSAILFGKIVWGGLGKNLFNPALLGREFMAVFFSAIMASPDIWHTGHRTLKGGTSYFAALDWPHLDGYLSGLLYRDSGAMGEHSFLAIAIGGLYLLLRNRISWHIPFSLLAIFSAFTLTHQSASLSYSSAGILLGAIFMATDMPSSPTTPHGKLFYGAMVGICIVIFLKADIRHEYMSYAILLLNGFSETISHIFRPRAWGEVIDWKKRVENIFLLTLKILLVAAAIITLHKYGIVSWLVYLYIPYIIVKFNFSFSKSMHKHV